MKRKKYTKPFIRTLCIETQDVMITSNKRPGINDNPGTSIIITPTRPGSSDNQNPFPWDY